MVAIEAPDQASAQYLALGDSYTIGEGVAEGLRWPTQLVTAMRARGIAIAPPHYIARTGWTSDELAVAIEGEESEGRLRSSYDLVSLQIGVNDQYRGRPVEDFSVQFVALLMRAITFAGGKPEQVVVLSIPDWGTTPFARASGRDREHIARQLDAYNASAAAACRRSGATWVDITDLTRDPQTSALLADDGLHPSAEMYALWARRVEAAR